MTVRKDIRSIAEFVSDVAGRKKRAAQSRFRAVPSGTEAPRDVYLAACRSVGTYLEEELGFRYAPSGPHAHRRAGDFTYRIAFQSSHHNVAGIHVDLGILAGVRSAKFKKWRGEGARGDDYVAGGDLGNLRGDAGLLSWDLADPARRDEVIADIVKAIEEIALPYFARFEDVPSLFETLATEDLPAMSIEVVVEFLVCFADRSTARRAAASFLRRRPDLVRGYRRDLERFRERGLDWKIPSGYTNHLAQASVRFEFGDLTE